MEHLGSMINNNGIMLPFSSSHSHPLQPALCSPVWQQWLIAMHGMQQNQIGVMAAARNSQFGSSPTLSENNYRLLSAADVLARNCQPQLDPLMRSSDDAAASIRDSFLHGQSTVSAPTRNWNQCLASSRVNVPADFPTKSSQQQQGRL